jgi:tRNA-specific 2-thiouridylase
MSSRHVVVAMSGGVDSSVTAGLLQAQGYRVSGVTMQLQSEHSVAIDYALSVARHLGIPHKVLDLSQIFNKQVVEPFCREYIIGLTPNPCITCNHYIKFGALLQYVLDNGADYLATGHYARIESGHEGYKLIKGVDVSKDQSYFLYTLDQSQLQHTLFPLGNYCKNETRQLAYQMGLDKLVREDESQDICFLPKGDYASLVAQWGNPQPGDILDTQGNVLGKHKGVIYYTIGQRQGLGVSSNERLYVLELDKVRNRIIVGGKEQLFSNRLIARDLTWVSGQTPHDWANVTARLRYKGIEILVDVKIIDEKAEVSFAQPQWAVTPGQSVVFYRGDEVLGGGIIQCP